MEGMEAHMLEARKMEIVASRLTYFPLTGEFVWHERHGRARADRVAGHLQDTGYGAKRWIIGFGVGSRAYQVKAHRLAWWMMKGELPDEIDHIDGDALNNTWSNLREATSSSNKHNAHRQRPANKSGKRGVWHVKRDDLYCARITFERQIIELGRFPTLEEAVSARRAAELRYLGAYSPV
jgi:hypothetical protein